MCRRGQPSAEDQQKDVMHLAGRLCVCDWRRPEAAGERNYPKAAVGLFHAGLLFKLNCLSAWCLPTAKL